MEKLNRVCSVSLLLTASAALANEGLFELTQCPSLTRAVSLSLAEITEKPGYSQVKRPKFCIDSAGSPVVSANDNKTACINKGHRVSSKSPSLARAIKEVIRKETDET